MLVVAAARSGHPAAISAPITDIHYDVTIDTATVRERTINVAMHCTVTGTGPVVLALPAWSPGHYTILWFARRISHFTPSVQGHPVDWHQLDYQTWQIAAKPGESLTVSFSYLADTIDRAVAWTKPDFAFFNGTNVFLYPAGRSLNWPATVTVHVPSTWRVATGMPASTTPNTFHAATYHELVDHPILVGRFDIDSTQFNPGTGGTRWMRFVSYPASPAFPARAKRTLDWLTREARAESAVFKVTPWQTYTVLQVADTAVNGGGLEHEDSQLDEVTTSELDAEWLPWLYSHEMFHSWNVKRLRPADLYPYRYEDTQPTGWLWVSEGITDYYSDIATLRGGIDDSTHFLESVTGRIAQFSAAPPFALPDASLSVWVNSTDGTSYMYYPKGYVAGFLLDICIRSASHNRASLDDVMRTLYRTAYEKNRGFTPEDWWGTVSNAAGGRSFTDFTARYIDGREPFPYDSIMKLAGLRLTIDTVPMVRLNIGASPDSAGGVRVEETWGGSPFHLGDRILQIGDVPMRNDSSFEALSARYGASADSTLPATVRRGDTTVTLAAPVAHLIRPRIRLVVDANASSEAAEIRHGVFTGHTTPH
jgi:predicted metalloprotease with PDZ domain